MCGQPWRTGPGCAIARTAAEQPEARQVSTRARITATRFTNEYQWGDFKGSPDQVMQRYSPGGQHSGDL